MCQISIAIVLKAVAPTAPGFHFAARTSAPRGENGQNGETEKRRLY
jgi:hypothetical protein